MLAHEIMDCAFDPRHRSPSCRTLDAHPVISRRHIRRQLRAQRLIIEVGVQVGQDGVARTHLFDPLQGVVEAEMGGVRTIAQSVDDPHIQAFEEGKACFGNAFHIRCIGERSEAKTERADLAVLEIERRRLDRPARSVDVANLPRPKPQFLCDRRIRTSVRGLKNIGEVLGTTLQDVVSFIYTSRRRRMTRQSGLRSSMPWV